MRSMIYNFIGRSSAAPRPVFDSHTPVPANELPISFRPPSHVVERLRSTLSQGRSALVARKLSTARAHFEAALELHPMALAARVSLRWIERKENEWI